MAKLTKPATGEDAAQALTNLLVQIREKNEIEDFIGIECSVGELSELPWATITALVIALLRQRGEYQLDLGKLKSIDPTSIINITAEPGKEYQTTVNITLTEA